LGAQSQAGGDAALQHALNEIGPSCKKLHTSAAPRRANMQKNTRCGEADNMNLELFFVVAAGGFALLNFWFVRQAEAAWIANRSVAKIGKAAGLAGLHRP
jgi:hypothetical protein